MPKLQRTFQVLLLGLAFAAPGAGAQPPDAEQMVFMLEHMKADYPEVIEDGEVKDQAEYIEQKLFAREIRKGIASLPEGQQGLADRAASLERAIEEKAPAERVVPLIDALIEGLRPDGAGAGATGAARGGGSPLAYAGRAVQESVTAYEGGEARRAFRLAADAYLEGFEPVEQGLATAAPELKETIEHGMARLREAIHDGAPLAQIQALAAGLRARLAEAEGALSGASLGPALSFTAALLILLREGLEALLVVAAIAAFITRSGRAEGMRYVHGGWIGALGAGVLTWALAAYALDISGAARELSEGLVALIAAGMLFYVGFWLHDKAHAERWQAYIRDKLQGAVGRRALWGLGILAFVAVYREAFETILFYQALWLQAGPAGHGMVLAGFATAAAALVVLAWAILRLSVRLPLGAFFRANAALLLVLSVVFAGKGVAALQEAGKLPVDTVGALPSIELIGLYPNLQGLVLQVLMVLLALALWFRPWPRRARASA